MSGFLSMSVLVSGAMLGLAGLVALYRLGRGPVLLDRVIALDVLVTVFIGAVTVFMVATHTVDHLALLVVLAVVGWIGTLAFAIFLADRKKGGEQ